MIYSDYTHERSSTSFLYAVYAWMAAALSVSALTAYYVANTSSLFTFITHNPIMLPVMFIAQLGLVVSLSTMIMRMSFTTAAVLFMAYAVSVGVTFSLLLHVYTMASIATAFLSTAGMFGGMAVYGYVTKADLTGVGNIAVMALFGLILSQFINMWFRNPAFDFMISGAGVLIFCALTAYDTQKIKHIARELITDDDTLSKVAVVCALTLYLDFINLFLFLLRFLGKRRQD
jgi:uncharacterized protein